MHSWTEAIGAEKQQPYFRHIIDTVAAERSAGQTVYPPAAEVFNAFKATEFDRVKVVILGARPVSRRGTGAWFGVFGAARCRHSAVFAEYL